MKFLLIFTIPLFAKVVYEPFPYYFADFPIKIEVSLFNERFPPYEAGIFWANSFQKGYKYVSMRCSKKWCKAVIPPQPIDSHYLQYKFIFKFHNRDIESGEFVVNRAILPDWQSENRSQIEILGLERELVGFSKNYVTFEKMIQRVRVRREKPKIKEEVEEVEEESFWNFLKIFTP
jgi:hypothetical protein